MHKTPHFLLENSKQVGHSPGAPGKQGKVRESVSCIWSITASIDLDTKCAKKGIIY